LPWRRDGACVFVEWKVDRGAQKNRSTLMTEAMTRLSVIPHHSPVHPDSPTARDCLQQSRTRPTPRRALLLPRAHVTRCSTRTPARRTSRNRRLVLTRGFGIMIRIKHRSVSSGILLAATSYVHQCFHEEPEHEVSFPAVSSVLLSHLMARRFQRIHPDISGYIPDSAEKPGF